MKRFIFKTIVFIFILFILDRAVFIFLQSQRPEDYKIFIDSKKEFFQKNFDVDLLIIGDSHIADALDTRTLESCAKISSYNLGVYHSSPFENYYITKSALNHLKIYPKTVVLGTNPVMFNRNLSKGKYTPLILNFNIDLILNSNDRFDNTVFFKTYKERYIFKYLYRRLKGEKYKPTRKIINEYHGHLKFYNQIENTNWANFGINSHGSIINRDQVKYFIKTIELLRKHGIEIIIVNPPIWHVQMETIVKSKNYKIFKNIINRISSKYNIDVYNSNFNSFQNEFEKDCFLNTQHLNYNGSTIFTNHFCKYLNTL